jgi:NAD(P)-dependent dehydrogenase (short-subunit alcohol dehydrogenase family)
MGRAAKSASKGRVALVTGANRGMGLETCRALLARGLRVALTAREDEAAERALRSLAPAPASALALRLDVTDPASIEQARQGGRSTGEVSWRGRAT